MIKVVELFSGYGSQSLALENIGLEHEVVAISDIDKYALQAYSQLHKGRCPNLGDITKITELEYCDLLTYSFPCTSVSGAGKQEGLEEGSGTASSLLWECRRLIQSSKPKYLLMENVKALTSKKFKPYFDKWLEELEGMGYKNHWKIINAKEYLPQNRERVFCVSIREDVENDFNFDNVKNTNQMNLRLKDLLEENVDEKYYISQERVEELISKTKDGLLGKLPSFENTEPKITSALSSREHRSGGWNEIAGTLCARDYKDPKVVAVCEQRSDEGLRFFKDDCVGTLRTIDSCGDKRVLESKESFGRLGNQAVNAFNSSESKDGDIVLPFHNKIDSSGICPTITTRPEGLKTAILPIQNYRIRKLTPKECLRLMGLRDEQIDKLQGISNSQLYKMAGNSIVIPVLEAIFKELFKNEINVDK